MSYGPSLNSVSLFALFIIFIGIVVVCTLAATGVLQKTTVPCPTNAAVAPVRWHDRLVMRHRHRNDYVKRTSATGVSKLELGDLCHESVVLWLERWSSDTTGNFYASFRVTDFDDDEPWTSEETITLNADAPADVRVRPVVGNTQTYTLSYTGANTVNTYLQYGEPETFHWTATGNSADVHVTATDEDLVTDATRFLIPTNTAPDDFYFDYVASEEGARITADNNYFQLIEDSGNGAGLLCFLPENTYTPFGLAMEFGNTMTVESSANGSAETFTGHFDAVTKKFSITNDTRDFVMEITLGSELAQYTGFDALGQTSVGNILISNVAGQIN